MLFITDSKTGTDEMQKLQVNEVNTEPLKAEGSGNKSDVC